MIKKTKNLNGEEIRFYEKTHKYETDNRQDFISATTFIGKFFPIFDEQTISSRYAKKHKMEQQDVLDMWHEKRDKASALGTNVHNYCEGKMNGEMLFPPEPNCDREAKLFKISDEVIELLLEEYEFIEAEKIIFSEKYGIAGTIDLIMRNKSDGRIYILDWKTNEKITMENRYQRGLGPLRSLEDTKYNHYCLQLNLYKKLLVEEGYYTADELDMRIIHLKDGEYEIMFALDYMDEIDNMLGYRDNMDSIGAVKEIEAENTDKSVSDVKRIRALLEKRK